MRYEDQAIKLLKNLYVKFDNDSDGVPETSIGFDSRRMVVRV